MANYNLVINSKFSPFSYLELLAPVLLATLAHLALEEAYSDLEALADEVGAMADETRDPVTYARYKAYLDDLNKLADLLARQGLDVGSRRSLFNLKGRYSKDIVPIKNAITRRRELANELRAALLNDRSLMFDVDYANASLDYLLSNPEASYTPISGEDLMKRSALMAAAASKAIQSSPLYPSILNGQYFLRMQLLGYTIDLIMDTILLEEDAPEELKKIVSTIWDETGLDKYDKSIQDKARAYINQGLYEGIGTTSYDIVANRGYVSPLEKAHLDLLRQEFEFRKEQAKDAQLGPLYPDGKRYKPVGGGKVIITDESTGEVETISTSSGSTSSGDSGVNLLDGKERDTPIIIARTGGKWHSDIEGEDAPHVGFGWTRSNLVSGWGNYTLDNIDLSPKNIVTNLKEIPPKAREEISLAIEGYNLDLNSYNIVKVKAEGNRSEPYDYVLYPKHFMTEITAEDIVNAGLAGVGVSPSINDGLEPDEAQYYDNLGL